MRQPSTKASSHHLTQCIKENCVRCMRSLHSTLFSAQLLVHTHCANVQMLFHLINLARSLSCNLLLNRFNFCVCVCSNRFKRDSPVRIIARGLSHFSLALALIFTRIHFRTFEAKCRSFWGRS